VQWLDAPTGVLAFRRSSPDGDFVCLANTADQPVRLAAPGRLLLASTEVTVVEDELLLPADATVWWAV
jgi:alpha-glucosidase